MNNIYKLNTNPNTNANLNTNINFNTSLLDTYFCSYCLAYVESNKFKSLLVITNPKSKNSKCHFCERYLSQISNGPDFVKFMLMALDNKESESSILLRLAKISVWYYNDLMDNFVTFLKTQLLLDDGQIKNIYQVINELKALPSKQIINSKANIIILN
jgi:hypothetical protein